MFVNTTAASAPFLVPLAGAGRIVMTATGWVMLAMRRRPAGVTLAAWLTLAAAVAME